MPALPVAGRWFAPGSHHGPSALRISCEAVPPPFWPAGAQGGLCPAIRVPPDSSAASACSMISSRIPRRGRGDPGHVGSCRAAMIGANGTAARPLRHGTVGPASTGPTPHEGARRPNSRPRALSRWRASLFAGRTAPSASLESGRCTLSRGPRLSGAGALKFVDNGTQAHRWPRKRCRNRA
jgi:hypothetical protein